MDMTSMHPITAETAHERRTRAMPANWRSMTTDGLCDLLASLEQYGEWDLAELVELELEQREGSES